MFEDVQDSLREGPSLDAFRTERPVVCASWDEQAERWPVLMESVPTPVASTLVHAFPMLPERTLADVVGAAIVGGVPDEDGKHALWSERDKISQATGMIVAQLGLGPADALAVLRAHAFAHEASVANIATLAVVYSMQISAEQAATRRHEALNARGLVEQAKGVIAYVDDVDMSTAYDTLLRRAEDSGESLTSAAAAVVGEQHRQRSP